MVDTLGIPSIAIHGTEKKTLRNGHPESLKKNHDALRQTFEIQDDGFNKAATVLSILQLEI